jgi:hypothetical protein
MKQSIPNAFSFLILGMGNVAFKTPPKSRRTEWSLGMGNFNIFSRPWGLSLLGGKKGEK